MYVIDGFPIYNDNRLSANGPMVAEDTPASSPVLELKLEKVDEQVTISVA